MENKGCDVDQTEKTLETTDSHNNVTSKPQIVQRRPDIDIIRIVLTWGILLYHVVLIYAPDSVYYVRVIPDPVPSWYYVANWFLWSMNAWNMPMFFFLSGVSAFNSLKKRSEKEFRLERVHRLLVPAMFIALTASIPISADYFGKLSPKCQEYYEALTK